MKRHWFSSFPQFSGPYCFYDIFSLFLFVVVRSPGRVVPALRRCVRACAPVRWALRLTWVLLALCGCQKDVLVHTDSALRFEAPVAFGDVWEATQGHVQPLVVVNDGRSTLEVTWTALEAPFSAELPSTLSPGSHRIDVTLDARTRGSFARWLTVSSPGLEPARTSVTAAVRETPGCQPSGPCVTARFDTDSSACVETQVGDGVVCEPDSKCLTGATCQSGRCVGTPVVCDDGNACTVDVCYPMTGCEYAPAPPCPGDGKCQVGVCNPATGCEMVSAADGTSCGAVTSCNAAEVCINGACVVRDPPDGYVCAEASPCQGEGRCAGDVCVREAPTVLSPRWIFDARAAPLPEGETAPLQLHDFVLESSGAATLSGFFQTPAVIRANTADALGAPLGPSRRCIFWGSVLVCADYPSVPNGRVTGIDPSNGATLWSFDLRTNRPDFAAMTTTLFLARLVVQGPDRLAALYEAYPLGTGGDGQNCRTYFLVTLDATGNLVMAQQLQDALLSQCNHPHPYGVASDSAGNLYIAFSHSATDQAPLVPGAPTLLMSYTHDGLFRWKLTDRTLVGGELAVARGLLYPENGNVALHATSGLPALTLATAVGRAVISDARVIPAPTQDALYGYEAGLADLRWRHGAPLGFAFSNQEVRLASWQTSHGPRTVALTFLTDLTTFAPTPPRLYAVDVATGAEAFSCPIEVDPGTGPQLFEVANGSLTVMDSALDAAGLPGCKKCDPPFAGSSGVFRTFTLPGVSIAREPWVGTFGGQDHDHHEDTQALGSPGGL